MNIEHYKRRLIDLEQSVAERTRRAVAEGRGAFMDTAHDLGDASVADEVATEQFAEAERDSALLREIRDALARVEHGTYGKCVVDGGPIEEPRLEAAPWTAYCLKHTPKT